MVCACWLARYDVRGYDHPIGLVLVLVMVLALAVGEIVEIELVIRVLFRIGTFRANDALTFYAVCVRACGVAWYNVRVHHD